MCRITVFGNTEPTLRVQIVAQAQISCYYRNFVLVAIMSWHHLLLPNELYRCSVLTIEKVKADMQILLVKNTTECCHWDQVRYMKIQQLQTHFEPVFIVGTVVPLLHVCLSTRGVQTAVFDTKSNMN